MQAFSTSAVRGARQNPTSRSIALHCVLGLLIAAGGYSLAQRVVDEPLTDSVVASPPSVATTPPVVESAPPIPPPEFDGMSTPGPVVTPAPAFAEEQFLSTWPPCSAVSLALDATVPTDLAEAVTTEVRTVLLLTGIQAVEAGNVDLGLMDDPERIDNVAEGVLVVGFTAKDRLGGDIVGTAATASDGEHTYSALVVIDESLIGTEFLLPVLRHELGHAVGLPHVDDPTQLMYPKLVPGAPESFQLDELAALGAIADRPCEVAP